MTEDRVKRQYTRRTEIRSEPVREPVRLETGDGGTVLRPKRGVTRTRPGHQDQLGIPQGILDQFPDVSFQWVTDSVLGKPEVQTRMGFEMNGWEPVPGEVFDGRFMPKGHKGEINVGGLVLMWRDKSLTDQALAEDKLAARRAVGANEEKLRAGQIDGVTLDTNHPSARKATGLTREVLTGMPVPK